MTPPYKIYLQYYGDNSEPEYRPIDHEDVTWSEDRINEGDFEYVRVMKERV